MQKDRLDNAVVKLWIILDEARGWSFADWLKEPRAIWWLAVSLGLFLGILTVWSVWSPLIKEWGILVGVAIIAPIALFVCVIVTWLTFEAFQRLLDSRPGEFLARRGTEVAIGCLIAFVFWTLIEVAVITMIKPLLFRRIVLGPIKLLQGMAAVTSFCLLWIWVMRALAYFVSMILYVGEFIVRRIAEYPKGPVIAASTLFAGVIALIKALGWD